MNIFRKVMFLAIVCSMLLGVSAAMANPSGTSHGKSLLTADSGLSWEMFKGKDGGGSCPPPPPDTDPNDGSGGNSGGPDDTDDGSGNSGGSDDGPDGTGGGDSF